MSEFLVDWAGLFVTTPSRMKKKLDIRYFINLN